MTLRTLFLFAALLFVSCSDDNKSPQQKSDKNNSEENENPADTSLTQEEKFSSSILVDFLNDSDDEDLSAFLESEVFSLGADYNGASVIEITPSTWLVILEKNDSTKNYLLQKYVDFKSNEYYFNFQETSLKIEDIITRSRQKKSAGE